MNSETEIINAFLDICAPSLDPESMNNVAMAVWWVCENRHIDKSGVHPWGIEYPFSESDREHGQFGVGS